MTEADRCSILTFPTPGSAVDDAGPADAEVSRPAGASQDLGDVGALSFDDLRQLGAELAEHGRFEEALEVLEQARQCALREDDQDNIDRADINVAAVAIELGDSAVHLTRLRGILSRRHSPENGLRAAYALGRLFERAKDFKKALYYARQALDRSRWVHDQVAAAPIHVHNLLGNALLADSRVGEAENAYRTALERYKGDSAVWRAVVLDNLGYCAVLQRRVGEGLSLIYRSLRTIRCAGATRLTLCPLIDLAFTLLEVGRPERAAIHAGNAFKIAKEHGELDDEKNALVLLGDAFLALDQLPAAHAAFKRLQERFYPELGTLPSSLLALNVRPLLSLRS